ncbi:MAG: type I DNA topoisomerase [Phycisphaeraceae bacterium]
MAKKTTRKTSSRSSRSRSGGSSGGGGSSKKPQTRRNRAASGGRTRGSADGDAKGKHLVIVESPTKAKTINKYLGPDYKVMASVGHVRDLPSKSPKGQKQEVPGVDLTNDFEPSYEVLPNKQKTVTELRKAAKQAADVWFATDLDREGEAIAWHLAEALGIDVEGAKRVVFNAITKSEIDRAFHNPHNIDAAKVNAQQARRILDRIVGYQVSPLLWKKVAGGLSAGRVQSVATRLVVEREREIEAFVPDEYWKITGLFTPEPGKAGDLAAQWQRFIEEAQKKEDKRTVREQNSWLSEHGCLRAELVELDGESFKVDNRDAALDAAQRLGFVLDDKQETEDPKAKGPAQNLCTFLGHVGDQAPDYRIESIQTKRTTSKPGAPFITSTMQQAAANRLGFALQRTMRIAQQLYEGVDLGGAQGQTGLITYMRTDSTHISGEALGMARDYIGQQYGDQYLPAKANVYSSSNRDAQEAHEAIRPTDVSITPQSIKGKLSEEQFKLYDLVWRRFVASQMTPAQWDSTTILIQSVKPKAVFRATGRTLVFDGFYKVMGVPTSDDVVLPTLEEQQPVAPIALDPTQHFTSPPARYTEASLQKKLEEEGIGRPSTYAAIIQTIQDRQYVQQVSPRDRRLMATDLGKVVTDMLTEAFPRIMDVPYTREMEAELDKIEEEHHDWRQMLREFYGPFKENLDDAHETLQHAKAVTEEAPYECPECGGGTMYRFGKNGRFLSCANYPDCKYAAPIDREGKPMPPETTDILCPVCGEHPMTRRVGRFGPFLGCENYPECKGIVKLDKKGQVVLPKAAPMTTDIPCPKCEAPLYMRDSKRGFWLSCSKFPKCRGRVGWSTLDEAKQQELEKRWHEHLKENPVPVVRTTDGRVIEEGYAPRIVNGEDDADRAPDEDTSRASSDAA